MSSEISVIGDETPIEQVTGAIDFSAALNEGADRVRGSDLVSGEENYELFRNLIGVPFAITRVVFRPGDVKRDGKIVMADWVSIEAVMADEAFMAKRKVSWEELPMQFWPSNSIVFNDGSTGIRRQVVEYLFQKGWIELPQPLVTSGAAGMHSFDLPVDKWVNVISGEITEMENDRHGYARNLSPVLICPRGLRESTYPDPSDPTGKRQSSTLYLA